ncbi:N-alpha-acetyltransferase 60 [Caenorhabditis elegans]|nr:N-alpha-acetyltransferase 60 [Caenorhabditis elegans]CAG4685884.1 N-alpha-acetyltransferase 60 [Caenorhabditis elegans]
MESVDMTPSSSTHIQQPLALSDSFTLRRLQTWDRMAVEALCNESFPIQYPDCWYDEVVSGGLLSTGLFDGEQLAAMVVSETKFLYDCNLEDQGILPSSNAHVAYILSIAVDKKFRRLGLATRLLNNLMSSLSDHPPYPRAVFLHVLSTNSAALSFYKMHGFEFHASLPYFREYYRIGEQLADGCTYVKYINGTYTNVTFTDVCRTFGNTICMPLKAICKMLSF